VLDIVVVVVPAVVVVVFVVCVLFVVAVVKVIVADVVLNFRKPCRPDSSP